MRQAIQLRRFVSAGESHCKATQMRGPITTVEKIPLGRLSSFTIGKYGLYPCRSHRFTYERERIRSHCF